jgi:hypothetical protein
VVPSLLGSVGVTAVVEGVLVGQLLQVPPEAIAVASGSVACVGTRRWCSGVADEAGRHTLIGASAAAVQS